MRILKSAIPLTNQIYTRFLKDNLGLIAGFAIGSEILTQYFTYMDKMTSSETSLNFTAKVGLFLTGVLMMVFYSLLIPLRISEYDIGAPRKSIWKFSHETLWPLTLENLRALAMCLLWLMGGVVAGVALLGIFIGVNLIDRNQLANLTESAATVASGPMLIPALLVLIVMFGPTIFFYLRYNFVSYVVLADPEYKAGRVDALKRSFELVKGVTFLLIFLLIVMGAFETWRDKLRDQFTFMNNPFMAIAVLAVFEAIGLYFNILLFRIYELRQKSLNA